MKKKILGLSLSLSLLFGAAAAGVVLSNQKPARANALTEEGGYVLVHDATEFKTVFNGGADYASRKIKLVNDIDLTELNNGDPYSWSGHGIAGAFTGEIDGNGKQISGFTMAPDMDFVNEVTESAVIKDLTIVGTPRGNIYSPMTFWAYGSYTNVTSVIHIQTDVNTISGLARVASNAVGYDVDNKAATFTNCSTHYVFDNDTGNTFRALYNENRKNLPTVTNCVYTVSGLPGSYTASSREAKVAAQGAVYNDNVVGVEKINDITVPSGNNEVINLVTYGTSYTNLTVSSSDPNVATVSNNGLEVTVTGVAKGDAVITVQFTTAEGTVSKTFNVTVEGAAYVEAINFDKENLNLVEELSDTITATLKGNVYESMTWSSLDETVATVSGGGLTGAVTAVGVGSTSIRLRVVANGVNVDKLCAVTVTAATKFDIYALDLVSHSSPAMYMTFGSEFKSNVQMAKVKGANAADVKILYDDPSTDETTLVEYYLWKATVNVEKTGLTSSSEIAFNMGAAGRYGWGGTLGEFDKKGATTYIVPRLPYPAGEGDNPLQDHFLSTGWMADDVTAAISFANTTIYSGTWRDGEDSICSYATMASVVAAHTALSADVKAIADSFDDSTTAYKLNTLGDTIAMFETKLASSSRSIGIVSMNSTTYLIIIIAAASVSAIGIVLFVIRKRKHE